MSRCFRAAIPGRVGRSFGDPASHGCEKLEERGTTHRNGACSETDDECSKYGRTEDACRHADLPSHLPSEDPDQHEDKQRDTTAEPERAEQIQQAVQRGADALPAGYQLSLARSVHDGSLTTGVSRGAQPGPPNAIAMPAHVSCSPSIPRTMHPNDAAIGSANTTMKRSRNGRGTRTPPARQSAKPTGIPKKNGITTPMSPVSFMYRAHAPMQICADHRPRPTASLIHTDGPNARGRPGCCRSSWVIAVRVNIQTA